MTGHSPQPPANQEMILSLKHTDYACVKHLFQGIFDLSEDAAFIDAWRHRTAGFGVWDRGALVGAAIVSKTYLKYIFVHENYQNAGIGSRLLRAVLAISPNIHLTPVPDPAVQKWYIKHGFRCSVEDGDYIVFTRHTHSLRSRGPA